MLISCIVVIGDAQACFKIYSEHHSFNACLLIASSIDYEFKFCVLLLLVVHALVLFLRCSVNNEKVRNPQRRSMMSGAARSNLV